MLDVLEHAPLEHTLLVYSTSKFTPWAKGREIHGPNRRMHRTASSRVVTPVAPHLYYLVSMCISRDILNVT